MNWEFQAAIRRDVPQMIEDFRSIMADGIDEWLLQPELMDKQEESWMSEFPRGFYNGEVSYRFRFRMGFYGKKGYVSLDPDEFDIKVEQTFHGGYTPSYDGLTKVSKNPEAERQFFATRIRRINDVAPIV